MTKYFIIPGLGNSGEDHWQTHLEKTSSNFSRIQQNEWDAPVCSDWIETVDKALKNENLLDVVLIGHSLGCTTIVQWALKYKKNIKGALLVAPSDLESAKYTFSITGFTPIPLWKIPFKSVVVASTNDPWVSTDRAKFFAKNWNSQYLEIGDAGHINTVAGYGKWPGILDILNAFE